MNLKPDQKTYADAWEEQGLSFTQAWEWAEIPRGSKPHRLIIEDMPALVFVRTIPGIGGKFGYIPRGFNTELVRDAQKLADIAKTICEELSLTHLVIDPNAWASTEQSSLPWQDVGFVVEAETIQPRYSNHLGTTKTDEVLLAGMEHDARRRVKQAMDREDLTVREDNSEEGLRRLYATLHGVSQRSKFVLQKDDYFVQVFKAFENTGRVHLLFVEKGDELLYATFALEDNGFLRRLYGGPTPAGRQEPAGHRLLMETVRLCRERKLTYIDFWGVAPYDDHGFDKKHELYGISKFKAGFGGVNVTYLPQFIWVRDRTRFTAYRALLKTHRGVMIIRKLFT